MKTVAVLVLALVAGTGFARDLQQADANCNAYATLQIKVLGGSCWGATGATCSAVSSSNSAYELAFKDWYGGDYATNACVSGKAEAAAQAIATAVAEVYTNAYVNVQCKVSDKGAGRACGWSQANADAWATATAQAISTASADAGGLGFCLSDVQAISQVVVDVTAKALADGCAIGTDSRFSYDESYKRALQTGIAKAFASAAASSCKGDGSADASAQCFGDASGTSTGEDEDDGGSGSISRGDVAPCKGDVVTKCCARTYRFSSCRCESCSGNMQRTGDYDGAQLRTWVGEDGGKCVCA